MPSPQPPKQKNQKGGGPSMTTSIAPCTLSRGVGSQPMQDAVNPLVVNSVASLSSNSPPFGVRRGQSTVMTTTFIWEQIDMGLNDLML